VKYLKRKFIPEKTINNIAQSPRGTFLFKTDALNQFYPYELLNYLKHPSIIIPLRRTAAGMHHMLHQHGFNLKDAHFIDFVSKHINSPLEHKKTTYLQKISLKELVEETEKKAKALSKGPKTLFIDDIHLLVPHYGELKTRRFLDYFSKRMQNHMTKVIILADHRKLPKQVSKFLYCGCNEIIEIPK
jgi:hypothetical protein